MVDSPAIGVRLQNTLCSTSTSRIFLFATLQLQRSLDTAKSCSPKHRPFTSCIAASRRPSYHSASLSMKISGKDMAQCNKLAAQVSKNSSPKAARKPDCPSRSESQPWTRLAQAFSIWSSISGGSSSKTELVKGANSRACFAAYHIHPQCDSRVVQNASSARRATKKLRLCVYV